MKSFRNIRVIPVVVVAVFCLAVLKVAGLVLDGGYVFDYDPQSTTPSWAQQNLNFPGGPKPAAVAPKDINDITGSVQEKDKDKPADAAKEEKPQPATPQTKPDGVVLHPEENQQPISDADCAILERLQSRRQELDTRAREIDIRESLLKEAEKRIETKVEEMKAIEARTQAANAAKADAQ